MQNVAACGDFHMAKPFVGSGIPTIESIENSKQPSSFLDSSRWKNTGGD